MPFHSITVHYATWFRLIPLRSLNAECQERFFKDIKRAAETTNFSHDHLMTNSLIRLQVSFRNLFFCCSRLNRWLKLSHLLVWVIKKFVICVYLPDFLIDKIVGTELVPFGCLVLEKITIVA